MKNIVIITGASSGIGREFAILLDSLLHHTDEIWLIARRKDRLLALEERLQNKVRILPMDVTDRLAVEAFQIMLEEEKPRIRLLVNSAGFGTFGNFTKQELSEQLAMISVNCTAVTAFTYLCLPYMKKNSRIIQMASSAGFLPQSGFAVYAASKAYVLSFSRALREEVKDRGIIVTAVCPGPVETEFFDRAEKYGATLAIKKKMMVSAKRVVMDALVDSMHKRALSVSSMPIKAFYHACDLLPHSMLVRMTKYFI